MGSITEIQFQHLRKLLHDIDPLSAVITPEIAEALGYSPSWYCIMELIVVWLQNLTTEEAAVFARKLEPFANRRVKERFVVSLIQQSALSSYQVDEEFSIILGGQVGEFVSDWVRKVGYRELDKAHWKLVKMYTFKKLMEIIR